MWFVALPVAWCFRRRLSLPPGLAPAVAEGPVITCVATAFLWKICKDIYRSAQPNYREIGFYQQFVDQVNEHKEMLVAVAMLMYGVYRIRATKRPSDRATEGD